MWVRNDDTGTAGELHEIQLVAADGTCPAGTIAGLPDFDRRVAGAQDRIVVRGGRRKAARVPLQIGRDAFTSPSAVTPARCAVHLTVSGPGDDPTPENNVVDVQLEVVDYNDF